MIHKLHKRQWAISSIKALYSAIDEDHRLKFSPLQLLEFDQLISEVKLKQKLNIELEKEREDLDSKTFTNPMDSKHKFTDNRETTMKVENSSV